MQLVEWTIDRMDIRPKILLYRCITYIQPIHTAKWTIGQKDNWPKIKLTKHTYAEIQFAEGQSNKKTIGRMTNWLKIQSTERTIGRIGN